MLFLSSWSYIWVYAMHVNFMQKYSEAVSQFYKVVVMRVSGDQGMEKPAEKQIHREKQQLFHISSIHKYRKNFGRSLQALALLKKQQDDFVLKVLSEDDFEPYRGMISGLGLTGVIRFNCCVPMLSTKVSGIHEHVNEMENMIRML